MIRRTLAALCLTLTAGAAVADPLPLPQLSAYLEGITEAEAPFTQYNADGTVATGTLSIKRPGRMRFDYDPPEQSLVLASGGAVHVVDRKMASHVQTYPLSQTPLGIVLSSNVNLSAPGVVIDHQEIGDQTAVQAQDPRDPEKGSILMVFEEDPVRLAGWTIFSPDMSETTIALGPFRNADLPNALFRPPMTD